MCDTERSRRLGKEALRRKTLSECSVLKVEPADPELSKLNTCLLTLMIDWSELSPSSRTSMLCAGLISRYVRPFADGAMLSARTANCNCSRGSAHKAKCLQLLASAFRLSMLCDFKQKCDAQARMIRWNERTMLERSWSVNRHVLCIRSEMFFEISSTTWLWINVTLSWKWRSDKDKHRWRR